METQYKVASRFAQLLAKNAPQDEGARVMAAMATAKGQLSQVGGRPGGTQASDQPGGRVAETRPVDVHLEQPTSASSLCSGKRTSL